MTIYLTETFVMCILCFFSDDFISQGGIWVEVQSQKTEVVSGVLCLYYSHVCFSSGRKHNYTVELLYL